MPKRQFIQRGKPLTATFEKNCMGCKNFMYCSDPDRAAKYLCSKYTSMDDMWDEADKTADGRFDLSRLPFGNKRKQKIITEIGSDEVEVDTSWLPAGKDEKSLRKYLSKQIQEGKVKPIESMDDNYIDDGDILLANNFYHFMRKCLVIKPFPKQVEIGIGFMAEYCPRCSDMNWLSDVPVDAPLSAFKERASLLKHGRCRRCGVRKSELIKNEELFDYYTLAGLAGQRASKSWMVGFLTNYQTHRILKMENPAAQFGILKGQVLACHFTAPTWQQAQDNLWTPFAAAMEDSPWFKQYHEMLNYYQQKRGEELYKVMDTFVHYRHKRLHIESKAADPKTLRGYTRYAASVDEIGWFGSNVKNVKMNADQVFDALDRSLFTLKQSHRDLRIKGDDTVPQPILACVSSPSSWQDKICRLVKEAEGSRTMYPFHYASWEINPNLSERHPEMLEIKRKNPATFKRDFMAEPPMSASEFISDLKKFKSLFSRIGFQNPLRAISKKGESEAGRSMTVAELRGYRWQDQTNRILSIDAGVVNNSFALTMGRNDPDTGYPIIEGMLEIQPVDNKPISFTSMMDDIIVPIIQDFGVTMVVADRWQSKKLLTDLEEQQGVSIEEYSVKKPDFIGYRDAVHEAHIDMPTPEMKLDDIMKNLHEYPKQFVGKPVSHFLFQNVTVVETVKSVEKGENLTDDLFRSVILLVSFLTDPEFKNDFMGGQVAMPKKSGIGFAVSGSSGGGGGSGGAIKGIVVSSGS